MNCHWETLKQTNEIYFWENLKFQWSFFLAFNQGIRNEHGHKKHSGNFESLFQRFPMTISQKAWDPMDFICRSVIVAVACLPSVWMNIFVAPNKYYWFSEKKDNRRIRSSKPVSIFPFKKLNRSKADFEAALVLIRNGILKAKVLLLQPWNLGK